MSESTAVSTFLHHILATTLVIISPEYFLKQNKKAENICEKQFKFYQPAQWYIFQPNVLKRIQLGVKPIQSGNTVGVHACVAADCKSR